MTKTFALRVYSSPESAGAIKLATITLSKADLKTLKGLKKIQRRTAKSIEALVFGAAFSEITLPSHWANWHDVDPDHKYLVYIAPKQINRKLFNKLHPVCLEMSGQRIIVGSTGVYWDAYPRYRDTSPSTDLLTWEELGI